MTEKLLSEMVPGRVQEEKREVDFGLKAAPTVFSAARIPGLKKVA